MLLPITAIIVVLSMGTTSSKMELSHDDIHMKHIAGLQSPYVTTPPAFCYPGTTLPSIFGKISEIVVPLHLNNIGTHTFGITSTSESFSSEGGFDMSHSMERLYILWIAKYFFKHNTTNLIDQVDGYFCGGGTEGNIEGLWIGRGWLREPDYTKIGVIVSPLTHYSVLKGAVLLGIDRQIKYSNITDKFEMDVPSVENIIDEFGRNGINKIIIVGTVGTTICGSIDPIKAISDLIEAKTDYKIYFHIDASFGGYTAPFVD